MSVDALAVQRLAAAARVALPPGAAAAIAADLSADLAGLAPLRTVRYDASGGAVGVGAGGAPLRADAGPPYRMTRAAADLAPARRAGYVLVPRLAPPPGAAAARPTGPAPAADPAGDDRLATELALGT